MHTPQLGPEVLWDQHGDFGTAAGWGDGYDWASVLALPAAQSMEALSLAAGQRVKAVMLEENGGGCGQARAMAHVSHAFALQRIGHQCVAQAAAGMFWPGGQGATNGDYQIKFLADRLVRAPFWHAQRMLSASHQPRVVGGFHEGYPQQATGRGGGGGGGGGGSGSRGTSGTGGGVNVLSQTQSQTGFMDWMAAVSEDGATLVVRVQNPNPYPVPLRIEIEGGPWAAPVGVSSLSADSLGAVNDYDTPDAVAPVERQGVQCVGGLTQLRALPFSLTVLTLSKA